ncbi:polyprenol monophosphomannose synthase [Candidatus Woesearchaeota archaeon]|nr:polyprenol monophosphomannose synthase [Candidatus Woesearchaeota archaeon]
MKTVIFIPTYNERENIGLLIEEILSSTPWEHEDIHILVVDDDSPDGTWEVVEKISNENSHVHILRRINERGRGSAGVAGIHWAMNQGAEYLIEMDADFSHQVKYIPDFLHIIPSYDVLLGSRFVAGGADLRDGVFRHLFTRLANIYIRVLLHIPIHDCTSGYRCFRLSVFRSIDLDGLASLDQTYVSEGYILLYLLFKKGASMGEIPIVFEDRRKGNSSLNYKVILRGFFTILLFRLFKSRKFI